MPGAMADEVRVPGLLDLGLRGRVDRADGIAGPRSGNGRLVRRLGRGPQPHLLGRRRAAEPGALVLDGQAVQAWNDDVHQYIAFLDPRAA
ncbi:hypothetical protein G6F32_017171 [Rhizopus arrhizus]|nr:hypothetical protein G6F32_017171 [Rhizopus arrhizus]